MNDGNDNPLKRSTGTRQRPPTYFSQWMRQDLVIETRFSGLVTGAVGKQAEEQFFSLLKPGQTVRAWFVDTTAVESYTLDIKDSGGHFVERFRNQGGQFMTVVITKGPIRLMASTIALMSRMKMDIFDTRERGLSHLNLHVIPQLDRDASRP